MATNATEEDVYTFDQDQLNIDDPEAIRYLTLMTPRDLTLQFTKNPNTGDLALKTGSNAIKESIRNLILTKKKERPFQPALGSSILELLFEPNDIITEKLIEDEIRTTIENFERRAEVLDVIVNGDREGQGYRVKVIFSVINENEPVTFTTFLTRSRGT
tara:strand:+ start:2464 stop:2940 length:477 start_codon:yes stop_codon:yes gene_type:complete